MFCTQRRPCSLNESKTLDVNFLETYLNAFQTNGLNPQIRTVLAFAFSSSGERKLLIIQQLSWDFPELYYYKNRNMLYVLRKKSSSWTCIAMRIVLANPWQFPHFLVNSSLFKDFDRSVFLVNKNLNENISFQKGQFRFSRCVFFSGYLMSLSYL